MKSPEVLKIYRAPAYRTHVLTLVAAGAASSCGSPLLSIYVTTTAGGNLSQAGYITTTSLFGSLAGLVLGHVSDRRKSNLQIIRFSALLLSLGWLAVGWTRNVTEVFLISTCFLSLSTVLSSQVYSAIAFSQETEERGRGTVSSALRACFSLGYAVGPLLGSVIAEVGGVKAAFLASGVLYASIIFIAKNGSSGARKDTGQSDKGETSGAVEHAGWGRVVLVGALLCMVVSGDFLKSSYLPIYIVHGLGYSVVASGVLLGLCAGLELIAFPVMGMVSARFGAEWTIALAVGMAALGYTLLAGVHGLAIIYVVQLAHVWAFAAIHGVGPVYMQRLLEPRIGVATAAFFFAVAAGKVLSGVMGGIFASPLGLPGLFWAPAVICAVVFVFMVFSAFRERARKQPEAMPHALTR